MTTNTEAPEPSAKPGHRALRKLVLRSPALGAALVAVIVVACASTSPTVTSNAEGRSDGESIDLPTATSLDSAGQAAPTPSRSAAPTIASTGNSQSPASTRVTGSTPADELVPTSGIPTAESLALIPAVPTSTTP
ncbi:MAG: hypothetical protein O3C10_12245, partial [Chloroflexi bacterium]|nr:hypothetical protein [Chloroflexota bacterium]